MNREQREELRQRIDQAKRARLARASGAGDRDVERRRASWRAYYHRRKGRAA